MAHSRVRMGKTQPTILLHIYRTLFVATLIGCMVTVWLLAGGSNGTYTNCEYFHLCLTYHVLLVYPPLAQGKYAEATSEYDKTITEGEEYLETHYLIVVIGICGKAKVLQAQVQDLLCSCYMVALTLCDSYSIWFVLMMHRIFRYIYLTAV